MEHGEFLVENVENLRREEEEREAGGGLKSARKRKIPSWRSENEAVWEEEEENENEKKETPLVRKRKFYSQRKKTFSPEEKGVRMLQTPVSELDKHKLVKSFSRSALETNKNV